MRDGWSSEHEIGGIPRNERRAAGLVLEGSGQEPFHLRFQSATERLETPSEIRKAKREIARIQDDSA